MAVIVRCFRALSYRALACALVWGIVFPVQMGWGQCNTTPSGTDMCYALPALQACQQSWQTPNATNDASIAGKCIAPLQQASKSCTAGWNASHLQSGSGQAAVGTGTTNAQGTATALQSGAASGTDASTNYTSCIRAANQAQSQCKGFATQAFQVQAQQIATTTAANCKKLGGSAAQAAAAQQQDANATKQLSESGSGSGSSGFFSNVQKMLPWLIGAGLLGAGIAYLTSSNSSTAAVTATSSSASLADYSSSSIDTSGNGSSTSVAIVTSDTITNAAPETVPPGTDATNISGVNSGEGAIVTTTTPLGGNPVVAQNGSSASSTASLSSTDSAAVGGVITAAADTARLPANDSSLAGVGSSNGTKTAAASSATAKPMLDQYAGIGEKDGDKAASDGFVGTMMMGVVHFVGKYASRVGRFFTGKPAAPAQGSSTQAAKLAPPTQQQTQLKPASANMPNPNTARPKTRSEILKSLREQGLIQPGNIKQ